MRLSSKVLIHISILGFALASAAKEAPITAIELYDGPNGAAYVQLTDVLLNGKVELRACEEGQMLNKSSYGKLGKTSLVGATDLSRRSNGVLVLTRNSATTCVLPINLKLEKQSLSPGAVADLAVLQGTVVSSSIPGVNSPPALKPGVELVFVPAPDVELAEYLRANRAHSIAQWQDYLGRYPKAPHVAAAKQALSGILLQDGTANLQAYKKSSGSGSVAYDRLNDAAIRVQQVHDLGITSPPATQLAQEVRAELDKITESASAENQAYTEALSAHRAGYVHLGNARQLVRHVLDIDSSIDRAKTLSATINSETQAIESAMSGAESLIAAQHYDDAVAKVSAYREFAGEEPRIAAVIDGAYKYHFDRGTDLQKGGKLQDAVNELQKGKAAKDTPEITAALKNAEDALKTAQDRAAADAALQESQNYEQDHDEIDAYEVLADLAPSRRALVADRLETLQPLYVKAASDKAKELQEAHTPIKGRVDEIGVQKAYDYLQRASALSDDNNLKLRLDLLGETISDYYVAMAKKYFDKPLGSGVGMGWEYLNQAQYYKPNRDDVRDERTKSSATYQMRSKLSIRVVFRDQTSRRDSAGFADQLADALATGLETSGLPVRVLRPNDRTDVDPNFELVGDVLQHRPIVTQTVDPMESKYRAGERELPNEEWNKANRDYEAANLDLQNAQRLLEGAQARGKKKEVAEISQQVAAAQKKVEDAHSRLDALPKTVPSDIVKPYTYTKKTIDMAAIVELAFRIVDSSGNTIDTVTPILKQNKKTFVVLENVKPEDTEGVKAEGAPPDQLQFLTDVEIEARDTLIKAAKDNVTALPGKILELARKRAKDGDAEGAAEAYILYLNSTSEKQNSRARDEAAKYLEQQFNLRAVLNSM